MTLNLLTILSFQARNQDALGQGSFLGTWERKAPQAKNLRFFRLETLINFTLNKKLYP